MILLDLEPINEKLRRIRKEIIVDIESCKTTSKQYKEGGPQGIAYAQQYDLSATYLERYLKQIEKALPQLKDDSE